jgi:D-glycero-alpha-D-manno-heptose 1-phosphate guanylyltransferase
MKAVVLCGGLGTRLGDMTRETPKPLIPVAGRPFLAHVLDQLTTAPIDEIILAVSFHWQKVLAEIGDSWCGVKISYSIEQEALGTGGAIKQAMRQSGVNEALVVNGDTFLKMNAGDLLQFAKEQNADIAIALKQTEDSARFGKVNIDELGRVLAFEEKGQCGRGLINSGVYYVRELVFASIQQETFSFEKDVLTLYCSEFAIYGMPTDAYFIDMGVLEDLARARTDLSNFQQSDLSIRNEL